MAYLVGTSSHATTGIKTITCGFQPIGARITVGQKDGITDAVNRFSVGFTDGTNQFYVTTFRDGTGAQTISGSGKMVSVLNRVGGLVAEVVQATFNSFTATQLKYNVNTADVNYTFNIEIWS